MFATKSVEKFTTLVHMLHDRIERYGDARAFIYLADGESREVRLSFSTADQQARAVAAHLGRVAQPGDRAILIYPPGLDSLPAFFGCLYAGIVAVPVVPPRLNQPPKDLLTIMAETHPTVILTTSQILPGLSELLQSSGCTGIATDVLEMTDTAAWSPPPVNDNDLAFLHFTSGSTKSPRGIRFDHRRVLNFLNTPMVDIEEDWQTYVSWAPFYTGMGLLGGALEPIFQGLDAVLLSPLDFITKPVRWLRTISRYPGVLSGGPNFAYQICLDRVTPAECDGLRLDSWRLMHCGAEPIRASTLQAFIDRYQPYGLQPDRFYTAYGLSEAAMTVSARFGAVKSITLDRAALARREIVDERADTPGAQTFVSCGSGFEGETIRLIDPDTLADCNPQQVGEIWVTSPNVLGGYWQQPEETAAVFGAYLPDGTGPYLRTGDLGFMRDGELYITGRIKDIVIVHGRNIYAQDIEQVAEAAHSAVQPNASAAFAVTLDDEEQLAIALEVKADVTNLDADAITRAVRRAVADEYQIPVYAVVLVAANTIPRTASGKVQRYKVRESFLQETQA